MDYKKICFMGVISCGKYQDRRQSQNLNDCPFEYKYFIGRGDYSSSNLDENVILLDCEDNYENLPLKVKKMIEWVLENRPHINYIFKTDDDISFDFSKLKKQFIEVYEKKLDYSGHLVVLDKSKSSYHFGKCENVSLNKPIDMEQTKYCAGGGYFLSKKSSKIIVNQMDKYKNIFEDYSVGRTLNENGIYPFDINLYKNSCFW